MEIQINEVDCQLYTGPKKEVQSVQQEDCDKQKSRLSNPGAHGPHSTRLYCPMVQRPGLGPSEICTPCAVRINSCKNYTTLSKNCKLYLTFKITYYF